jgi:hypothetical protein
LKKIVKHSAGVRDTISVWEFVGRMLDKKKFRRTIIFGEILPRQEYAFSATTGEIQKKELSYLMLVFILSLAWFIMAAQSTALRKLTFASFSTVDLAPLVKGL